MHNIHQVSTSYCFSQFVFFLIILPAEQSCNSMVHPANASFVKNVLHKTKWNTEIEREVQNILILLTNRWSFFHILSRTTKILKRKWALCAMAKVPHLKKEELLSRCTKVSIDWGETEPRTVYTTKVPMAYGLNFTVTAFHTTYSGEFFLLQVHQNRVCFQKESTVLSHHCCMLHGFYPTNLSVGQNCVFLCWVSFVW